MISHHCVSFFMIFYDFSSLLVDQFHDFLSFSMIFPLFIIILHSPPLSPSSDCYNHPPFQEINKGMNCHTCPHQTCKHSLNHHRVANCEECQVGDLVIDPVSAPNWKIACNHCQCVLKFQPDVIFKMKVVSGSSLLPSSQFSDHSSNPPPDDLPDLEDLSLKQAQPHQRDQHQKNQPESSNSFCDSCGANQIHLVFVKDKSPL
eukprot:Sdes_comp20457_c0_seq1m14673